EGAWCAFEPLQDAPADELLPPEEAYQRFREIGILGRGLASMEPCWFLQTDGTQATATLAYRIGNAYLDALNGFWLQTQP
ncbi:MAG: hypothetical protein IJ174_02400, partial [Clostridia bacterium]|nr:hypothetical protein [Clostridia bacterium]